MLEIDELFDGVALGEPGSQTLAMFIASSNKVVRHTDIQGAMTVLGEDIDVELAPCSQTNALLDPPGQARG